MSKLQQQHRLAHNGPTKPKADNIEDPMVQGGRLEHKTKPVTGAPQTPKKVEVAVLPGLFDPFF